MVGFTVGMVCGGVGHVCTIDVAADYRRRGIGIKLLRELERQFEKLGVKVCFLEVRSDNVAARELYRKMGYEEVKELRDYYDKGVHGIQLLKQL